MSVSRRLRFEVLRRDDHTCRYCGGRAPDVALTVDHVIPVALGGSDEPSNLVAACADCNAGKSSVPADAPLVDAVAADALRWSQAMNKAAEIQAQEAEFRSTYIDEFDKAWCGWTYEDGSTISRPSDWRSTVGRFHDRGLELAALISLVNDVCPRRVPDHRMWQYFNGAVRNVLHERQLLARDILDMEEYR